MHLCQAEAVLEKGPRVPAAEPGFQDLWDEGGKLGDVEVQKLQDIAGLQGWDELFEDPSDDDESDDEPEEEESVLLERMKRSRQREQRRARGEDVDSDENESDDEEEEEEESTGPEATGICAAKLLAHLAVNDWVSVKFTLQPSAICS